MPKAKNKKKHAHELTAGDLIEIGGKIYEHIDTNPAYMGTGRLHLNFYLLDGHEWHDRVMLTVHANVKFQLAD